MTPEAAFSQNITDRRTAELQPNVPYHTTDKLLFYRP
jgi:hypothetical protein